MKKASSLLGFSAVALTLIVSACGRAAPVLPAPDGAVSLSSFAAQLHSSSSAMASSVAVAASSAQAANTGSSSAASVAQTSAAASVSAEPVVTKGSL